MAKYVTIYILLLLCLVPSAVYGADRTQYSGLVEKVRDLPSENVMRMAGKYAGQGKDAEAIVLYTVVADRFRDDSDDGEKNTCVLARHKVGQAYYDRGDYVNALGAFVEAAKMSEQCGVQRHVARIYNSIGNVYCIFLDYEKGVNCYKKALAFTEKQPDRDVEHDILVNLTGILTFMENVGEARKYYKMSENKKDPANPVDVYMSGYNLCLLQLHEENIAPAIARLKRLAVYAKDKGIEPKYQCFAYQELFNAYDYIGMPDSTLKYMLLCDSTASVHNLQHTFATTKKYLADFYEKHGDSAKSNAYRAHYLDIMDSIYNMREFEVVENTLFTWEVGKTAKEISDLQRREQDKERTIMRQRLTMCAVAVVTLVLALLLALVWRQKRRIDRSYADLYLVNRNFVDTQAQLTARLRQEAEASKGKDAEIARLKERLGQAPATVALQPGVQEKYRTSNLGEEQCRALAERIQGVMENTTAFCDCDFSVGMLAGIVGSNVKYVSQAINDTYHKSFNDYVNPYRIHLACARFADKKNYGHLTMKAVGESVGFRSYTSFVNIFRKVTGITPSIYCKMAAQENAAAGRN